MKSFIPNLAAHLETILMAKKMTPQTYANLGVVYTNRPITYRKIVSLILSQYPYVKLDIGRQRRIIKHVQKA
jgi:hypothetical protein